jgi:hypothetical protein
VKNKVNSSFLKILLHKLVENPEEEKILVEFNEKVLYFCVDTKLWWRNIG